MMEAMGMSVHESDGEDSECAACCHTAIISAFFPAAGLLPAAPAPRALPRRFSQ